MNYLQAGCFFHTKNLQWHLRLEILLKLQILQMKIPEHFGLPNTAKAGESVTIDLQKEYDVKAVQIHFVDYKSDIYDNDSSEVYTQYKFYSSLDGNNWDLIVDLSNVKQDRPNGYFELEKPS